ncbi:MAG TPA: hypothetical protein VGL77_18270 [Armatimonadota bacterium]
MELLQCATPPISHRADPLGRMLFALAVLALALAPTQITLPHLPVSPAELLLGVAGLVWALRWLRLRDSSSLPPFVNWLLVIACAVSVLGVFSDQVPMPGDKGEFLKDFAKMLLYPIVGFTIFRATLTTPARLRTAVIALLLGATLAVGLGVAQRLLLQTHYQPDATLRSVFMHQTPRAYLTTETPIEVSATFGSWDKKGFHASRTAYAAFLALALPFALVLLITERRRTGIVAWISVLFLGAAASVLAGFIAPAILLGLLVTGFALGRQTGRAVLLGVLCYVALLLLVGGHNRTEILQEPFRLQISATDAGNPNFRYDGVRHLKKFWGEQCAALNLLRGTRYVAAPALFGVGLGQYQKNIQEGYGGLSEVTNQRLESDAQNGYLLMTVSCGIFGLAAFLALCWAYLATAWRQARAPERSPWSAAVLGALVALVVMTLATNPWVRGNALLVAAVLALTLNIATFAPVARITK